jgi:hypothetical protein
VEENAIKGNKEPSFEMKLLKIQMDCIDKELDRRVFVKKPDGSYVEGKIIREFGVEDEEE